MGSWSHLAIGWVGHQRGRVGRLPAMCHRSNEMLYLILKRWSQLPDTLKSHVVFGHGNLCWPAILAAERGKQIKHGDVDVPARDERWRF